MRWLLALLVVATIVVHQDFWLWSDKTLVFGVMPIGLAYHAGYSVLAAFVLGALVKFAWPTHLEEEVAESGADLSGGFDH